MKLKIAQCVNILLLLLVTGVFWGTWFSLSRSIASIAPQTFLAIGRIMIGNLAGPMPILMPLALVSTLPVLILLYRQKLLKAFYLTLVGLALFIVALLVTLLVNVPIDGQIAKWTVETLPPDWESVRSRWEFYHVFRTFASLTGFGFILISALFSSDSNPNEEFGRSAERPQIPKDTRTIPSTKIRQRNSGGGDGCMLVVLGASGCKSGSYHRNSW